MLRNEDRLYHIVVSFPSICAKQFLIFRIKKNEAICCLIGFGIGIGCCLMYRWLRNSFVKTEFFYNLASNRVRYAEQPKSIATAGSGGDTSKSNANLRLMAIADDEADDDDERLIRKAGKNASKVQKKDRGQKSKSKLKCSASQLLANKYSTLASVSRAASKSVSKYLLSQPLSMIYANIAKYLVKEFFKNSKLKRSLFLKEKPMNKKQLHGTATRRHHHHHLLNKSSHATSESSPFLRSSPKSPLSLANWSNMLTNGHHSAASKELCLSRKLNDPNAFLNNIETILAGSGGNRSSAGNDNSQMIQRKRAFLNDLNNRSLVYHLRMQQHRSKTSSNPFLSKVSKHEFEAINNIGNNKMDLPTFLANSPNHNQNNNSINSNRRLNDYLNGDPLSLNNNCLFASKKNLLTTQNRSLFDDLSSPSLGGLEQLNSSSKSEMDSLYRSNSQMFTDLGLDEELQEFLLNSSHRSSIYDFDDSSDSKSNNPMIKTDNYVDKSLEEALHHIDKLKEDMNHLCKDIDSLYNIKGGSGEFTAASFKHDDDELDENEHEYDYHTGTAAANENNEYEEIDHIKSLIDSNNLIESNQLVNESMRHLRDNLDQFKSKKQLADHLSRRNCAELTTGQRCQCVYSDNYASPSSSLAGLDDSSSASANCHDYFHCRNSFCANSITRNGHKQNHFHHDAATAAATKQPSTTINECNESSSCLVARKTAASNRQQQLVNPVNISRITKRTTTFTAATGTLLLSGRRGMRKSSSFHKKSSSHYCNLSAKKLSDQSVRKQQS